VGSVAGTGCARRRWDRQDGQRTLSVGDAQGELKKGNSKMLISALVTFLVVILILYLINMLPIDGRAKQIARVVVIVLGVISLLKYIAVF
jgi:glucan phosphoethanolaminetransferase (alkaline phosphatase superfamily)